MSEIVTILGIESSCDDTAAAVVRLNEDGAGEILSSIVSGQNDLHANFGGVVPEIAARAHAEKLDHVTIEALSQAGIRLDNVDAIAVTAGPGLIGGVVSGTSFAKGLAAGAGLPIVPVNHLAGHALTPRLTNGLSYPYLLLLASGGHCQFLMVEAHDRFRKLGSTIDDAPGEAFDKVARILGLGQPGGPEVEKAAKKGDPARFNFPRPLANRKDCNMSFSGLKTAVLRARDTLVAAQGGLTETDQADISASFQRAVSDTLSTKTRRALTAFRETYPEATTFAAAGGVIANQSIRDALQADCAALDMWFVAPPIALCTDNAAMIAWVGAEKFVAGECSDFGFSALPRWPLDRTAPAAIGSGKKGAKA